MNCENIKEKLSLYIDNLLDPDETDIIREHIETCDSCRDYYDKLLKLGEMVDGFAISDKEDHWESQKDKVMEQIEQAESEKIIKVQSIKRRGRFYKYMAVAASLALVAFVSIYESQEFSQFNSMFDDSVMKTATDLLLDQTDIEEITVQDSQAGVTSEKANVSSVEIDDIKLGDDLSEQVVIEPAPKPKKRVDKSQVVDSRKEALEESESSAVKSLIGIPAPVETEPKPGEIEVIPTTADFVPTNKIQFHSYSPQTAEVEPLSFMAPKAGDKKEKVELSPEEMQTRAVEWMRKNGIEDADMAMSVGLDEDKVYMADLSADKDSAVTEINIYKNRLDSLEEKYDGIYSPHYMESSAKGRVATASASHPVSLDPVILEIAETCFQVGILSTDENEREEMIKKLRRLSINGSPESIEKIQRYIVLLLSAD